MNWRNCPSTGKATPRLSVYLDCDTGIDDAIAIAILLQQPHVDLLGIGTVGGNVDAPTGASNTLGLLALAGRDVPVTVGAINPILGGYRGGHPALHGPDGVGGVPLPGRRVARKESAPEMLVRLALAFPGDIRAIAIGPLTNFAHALELEPKLPRLLHSITIMGGAIHEAGNVTPWAEANFCMDPEAAAAVLAAGFNTTLVPLDATNHHSWRRRQIKSLSKAGTPLSNALGRMADFSAQAALAAGRKRRAPLHDPIAVAIAVGLIEPDGTAPIPLEVVTEGGERGQTAVAQNSKVARVVLHVPEDTADTILNATLPGRDRR